MCEDGAHLTFTGEEEPREERREDAEDEGC